MVFVKGSLEGAYRIFFFRYGHYGFNHSLRIAFFFPSFIVL